MGRAPKHFAQNGEILHNQGPIFHKFFAAESDFPWNFLENDFSKLFPRKIPFFPNIFWGKFSAEFSP
jgi:hypothetical protein